jgi:arylsulfatase A
MQSSRRAFLAAATGSLSVAAQSPRLTPNIVLVFCDDLGYGDIGPYGSPIRTPHLDRMAAEGVRFTNFYSANPVCSPSRAALLTGRYPTRTGVPAVLFPKDQAGLDKSETTIADALKSRGYRTMCVGKWHLGHTPDYLPTARGFDEYFGIPYSNDMSPRLLLHNSEIVEREATLETLTPRYTERAVKFIEQSKGSPFFLYLPHTYPHIPLAASARFRGKSPQGLYGDVIEELDWSMGELFNALKRTGQDSNTLVIFTSDNGPWFQGSPGKLRGRKGMTWEGGVRVPFLARWPGRIQRGRTVDGVASAMDLFPTITKLCGAPDPPAKLDGIDIWPLLSAQRQSLDREPLLYFDGWNVQCMRHGRWKMHVSRYNSITYAPAPAGGRRNIALKTPELYDVVTDVDESYDVAPERPEVVRDLTARLEAMIATFPEPVRKAYAETKLRPAVSERPGALPAT